MYGVSVYIFLPCVVLDIPILLLSQLKILRFHTVHIGEKLKELLSGRICEVLVEYVRWL